MAQLTPDTAKRLERLPHDLHTEFPNVPMQTIEHDVQEGVRELIRNARFTDYVPLLVHKTIRERLRATN